MFPYYRVANDFIEILGSYTYDGGMSNKIIPASRFCGVFDGKDLIFTTITSMYKSCPMNFTSL